MRWNVINVQTAERDADIVSFILTEEGASGTEITGGSRPEPDPDEIVPGMDATGTVTVKAYFGDEGFDAVLGNVKARLALLADGAAKTAVSVESVEDRDWNENFRKHFTTFNAAGRIVIKPSWEEYVPKRGEIVIEMDPGMAFGSGAHETTRMCLELIQRHMKEGASAADVGCGSGILGIACSKLGASRVLALDSDPVSVKVAAQNAKNNGVKNLKAVKSDLLKSAGNLKFDLIAANIIADALIRLNRDAARHMNPGAIYIISGIIEDRMGDLSVSLKENGFAVIETVKTGEWIAAAARQGG